MKRFLIVLIAFIILLLAGFLLLRGFFLDQAIVKVQEKIARHYKARLVIEKAYFDGFARVAFTNIALIPEKGDTLFYCKNTAASISLLRLLKGQPPINNIVAATGYIKIREYADSTDNFRFLMQSKPVTADSTKTAPSQVNYGKQANKLWNRFFSIADFNFNIRDFQMDWQAPSHSEDLIIEQFILNESVFKFVATDSTPGHEAGWEVNGIIDPDDQIINMEGHTKSGAGEEIPFFKKITSIKFFINTFGVSFSRDKDRSFNVHVESIAPGINHWRISPEDVILDSLRANFNIVVNDHEIKSGDKTIFLINQMPVVTEFHYLKGDSTLAGFTIDIPDIPAQDFLNSLPKGLFATLEGIKVKGRLSYHLEFDANLNNPDSLVFDSELKKSDFRILRYGPENFAAINSTFTHAIREKDVVVRNLVVGPENPKYVPLDQINPLLINAVLTAEDGTFRFHNGFNEEAFRQSIATNIREKRFARGGSTITMQLVKNVFLHRNKTISRKVEEALIVWLIENNNLVSKDRMLEVYLNIIEWGPGIYGIGEAAEFYFAKHPSQLSLEESIYLSSIIPRPKTFRYTFDKEGKMKDYLKGYFDLVAGRLLKKEIITQEIHDSLKYQIELKGAALQMVLPDSIPADSLFIDEPEELF